MDQLEKEVATLEAKCDELFAKSNKQYSKEFHDAYALFSAKFKELKDFESEYATLLFANRK